MAQIIALTQIGILIMTAIITLIIITTDLTAIAEIIIIIKIQCRVRHTTTAAHSVATVAAVRSEVAHLAVAVEVEAADTLAVADNLFGDINFYIKKF